VTGNETLAETRVHVFYFGVMLTRSSTNQWPRSRVRAFTLVEISVVVTLLGLLIAIGVPTYRRLNLKSKATATISDLRTFSGTFVTFNLQQAKWPDATGIAGDVPPELANALPSAFTRPTPIGGYYEWLKDSVYGKAAITISTANGSTATDDAELVELIDQLMDDGNPATGSIQIGATNNVVLIIEK
jgi:prepilin-type N-terminal cleavage/methylation domain-containing protein